MTLFIKTHERHVAEPSPDLQAMHVSNRLLQFGIFKVENFFYLKAAMYVTHRRHENVHVLILMEHFNVINVLL